MTQAIAAALIFFFGLVLNAAEPPGMFYSAFVEAASRAAFTGPLLKCRRPHIFAVSIAIPPSQGWPMHRIHDARLIPAGAKKCTPGSLQLEFQTDPRQCQKIRVSQLAARRRHYRPDIDGLRAFAVLSVLLYHAFPKEVPRRYVGVDIFFVFRFLISSILFAELTEGHFSFTALHGRRVRRTSGACCMLGAVLAYGFVS
jgi:hypothetical protein